MKTMLLLRTATMMRAHDIGSAFVGDGGGYPGTTLSAPISAEHSSRRWPWSRRSCSEHGQMSVMRAKPIASLARVRGRAVLFAALLLITFLPSCGGPSDKEGYEFARTLMNR
jgi:hypothetical protein